MMDKVIIYNYYMNKAIAMKKELADFLKDNLGEEVDNAFIEKKDISKLINNGIVIRDEGEYISKKFKIKTKRNHINTVYFHVTQRCNLNCTYCYNKKNLNKKDGLSTDDVKHILDIMKENDVKVVNFTGGEALVRNDITEIIEYAKSIGLKNTLLTNGTLLHKKMDVLKYLDNCIISIDNIDDNLNDETRNGSKKYCLSETLDLIDKNDRKKITIRSVIMKGQEKNIATNENFFQNKNYRYVFNICLPNSIDELQYLPDLKPFITGNQAHMCGAGKTIVAIDSNGDIYPCHTFIGSKEYYIGNVLHDDWGEKIQKHCNLIDATIENREKCRTCEYKFLCLGGCPNIAYRTYGNIYKENTFLCKLYKENANQFLRNIFERKMKNEKCN